MTHETGSFEGHGGLKLYEQHWRPTGAIRAALVIVHGLKDHGARYADLAAALVAKGIAVHALDLRGHGHSDGDRVWVDSFDDYLADLELFVARVKKLEGDTPLFLLGHSMGGAIATLFTLTRKPALKGLVLSAPALKVGADQPALLVKIAGVLGKLTPRLPVLDLDLAKFSRDAAVVADCRADPLVFQGKGPARTGAQLLAAIGRIQADMEQIDVPLLLLHRTLDTVTNPDGSRELHKRAASKDKTLELFDGLVHDLLHEPEKAQVIEKIVGWIDARANA